MKFTPDQFFSTFSEHFSFQSSNCDADDDADAIESNFDVRLANRYRNQTRVRICLGKKSEEFLCLNPILVAKDPDDVTSLSPSPGVTIIEAENVRLEVHRADNFGFDFWLRWVSFWDSLIICQQSC